LELLGEEIQTPEVLENAHTNDVDKLRSEANYWREKFEQQVMVEAYRMVQNQYQREKIGF
jgi:XRE family transcriptional regulator, regulator of sulfur utilization